MEEYKGNLDTSSITELLDDAMYKKEYIIPILDGPAIEWSDDDKKWYQYKLKWDLTPQPRNHHEKHIWAKS